MDQARNKRSKDYLAPLAGADYVRFSWSSLGSHARAEFVSHHPCTKPGERALDVLARCREPLAHVCTNHSIQDAWGFVIQEPSKRDTRRPNYPLAPSCSSPSSPSWR